MEKRKVSQSPEAIQHREEIEACFFEQLKHTPYKDISISEICSRLGISRKIFYRCYQGKEDCMNAIIDGVFRDSLLYNVRHMKQWDGSVESCTVVMEFWKSQKEFLDIIMRDSLLLLMITRAIDFSVHEDQTISAMLNQADIPCDLDILSSHICAHYAMILQWYLRDYDTPLEEMGRKYWRIIQSPLIRTF